MEINPDALQSSQNWGLRKNCNLLKLQDLQTGCTQHKCFLPSLLKKYNNFRIFSRSSSLQDFAWSEGRVHHGCAGLVGIIVVCRFKIEPAV